MFTVMNPGRTTVAVRDSYRSEWRLVLPVIGDVEWRFTDVSQGPHESQALLSFSFTSFLEKIESKCGVEAAKWTETAAFKARLWVKEKNRRWRYQPS